MQACHGGMGTVCWAVRSAIHHGVEFASHGTLGSGRERIETGGDAGGQWRVCDTNVLCDFGLVPRTRFPALLLWLGWLIVP